MDMMDMIASDIMSVLLILSNFLPVFVISEFSSGDTKLQSLKLNLAQPLKIWRAIVSLLARQTFFVISQCFWVLDK